MNFPGHLPQDTNTVEIRARVVDKTNWMLPSLTKGASILGTTLAGLVRQDFTVLQRLELWMMLVGLAIGITLAGLVGPVWILPAVLVQFTVLNVVLYIGNRCNDDPLWRNSINSWSPAMRQPGYTGPTPVDALSVVFTGAALLLAMRVLFGLFGWFILGVLGTLVTVIFFLGLAGLVLWAISTYTRR